MGKCVPMITLRAAEFWYGLSTGVVVTLVVLWVVTRFFL